MLEYIRILREAGSIYTAKDPDRNPNGIRSDQIRALAEAITNAVNEENRELKRRIVELEKQVLYAFN